MELFHETDYWQHPRTFEQLRRGDCEDHALWAWRKLVELGFNASFFTGQWKPEPDHSGGHAWVVFEDGGQRFVLEPVIKEAGRQVRPVEEVRSDYVPHYSVDRTYRIQPHAGLFVHWREEELARRSGRRLGAQAA